MVLFKALALTSFFKTYDLRIQLQWLLNACFSTEVAIGVCVCVNVHDPNLNSQSSRHKPFSIS